MNEYSVIIPTIWASGYTTPLLERLSGTEAVKEIILIDNTDWVLYPGGGWDFPKVKLIKEMRNTYVNPAWNKGVGLAECDKVVICNDDILFDTHQYFHLLNQMGSLLDTGFVGSHSINYTLERTENPEVQPYDNRTNTGGWGCLFAFHKRNWKPIPEALKIWYGDNWIHGTNPNIFQLCGIKIETQMSTSSDRMDVRDVRDNDMREWLKIINN